MIGDVSDATQLETMNFIYFNPDEMRADALGCYGHPVAKTPNIDKLAAQGTRFDQCHVQHPVCTPSRCSFMSGWYPHTRGHRTLWYPLQPEEPNTLKYLKQAGYDVHWIGKNDLLAQEGLEDSVTALHDLEAGSPLGDRNLYPPDHPGHWSFLYGPQEGHSEDWYRVERAIEILKAWQPGDPPFMLYLPLIYPHCPFTCPQPWYDMYDPDEMPDFRPADLPNLPAFHALIRQYRQLDKLDPAILRKVAAVYLGMISYIDDMLGRLMTALEETGLADDTTTFFFSDHGDWAGDYGLVEKWPSALDDCLTRVPMIVKTPGGTPGHVVHEPIECFDILPTTLELANIACQHQHFARSMRPQLKGAAGDPDRAVFAEGGYSPHEPHCYEVVRSTTHIYYPKQLQQMERPESQVRATMIRTATHKLIYRPEDISELYDLEADPRELHNVYEDPAYADIRRTLKRRLLDWYVLTSDVVPIEKQSRDYSPENLAKLNRP